MQFLVVLHCDAPSLCIMHQIETPHIFYIKQPLTLNLGIVIFLQCGLCINLKHHAKIYLSWCTTFAKIRNTIKKGIARAIIIKNVLKIAVIQPGFL